MSLLSFLRIVDVVQSHGARETAPPRNRRLELETLEGRALLTLLAEPAPQLVSIEEFVTVPVLEEPLSTAPETSLDEGGAGSGTGEPAPEYLTTDPQSESPVTDGGSGSGGAGGSEGGSGGGSGQANIPPALTLSGFRNSGNFACFEGIVTDIDGPVEGLTVYFTIDGGTSVAFTATVQADGGFAVMEMEMEFGTIVTAYTIDVNGNQSPLVSVFV